MIVEAVERRLGTGEATDREPLIRSRRIWRFTSMNSRSIVAASWMPKASGLAGPRLMCALGKMLSRTAVIRQRAVAQDADAAAGVGKSGAAPEERSHWSDEGVLGIDSGIAIMY